MAIDSPALTGMAPPLPPPRRVSSALLMGFTNLPFGLYFGLVLITTPQLLAARGVPEPQIASITAAALLPSVFGFLLAPLLDVWLSRRTYAWLFGALGGVLAAVAMAAVGQTDRFAELLLAGGLAATLYNTAIGGWLGDIVAPGEEGQLAAGFQGGNAAGFGLSAVVFLPLLRGLPGVGGAAAAGAVVAAPLALLPFIRPSRRDRLGLHESFATLGRDLVALVRRPVVRRALLLFVLPTCAFAMSNSLTGLGRQFGATEQFVSVVAGPAVTVVGILGSLLAAPLVRRFPPGWVFLAIGVIGAAFTASLIVLPRAPWVLALGISGENGLQSVALAVASAIIFRSIGDDNPLAATQFALLISAAALPITYMQWVFGHTYAAGGGLPAGLACDAGLALAGALVLAPVLRGWRRGGERAF